MGEAALSSVTRGTDAARGTRKRKGRPVGAPFGLADSGDQQL